MKATVEVTQFITIEVPDSLLTEEFMKNFREYFYDFEDPEEHLKHLAQMYARGVASEFSFIEGYGDPQKVGIKFKSEEVLTSLAHLV